MSKQDLGWSYVFDYFNLDLFSGPDSDPLIDPGWVLSGGTLIEYRMVQYRRQYEKQI